MKSVSIRSHQRPGASHAVLANLPDLKRTATQLIRDVGVELRAPLSTLRQSIQSVHDGLDGSPSGQQQAALRSAMQQCDHLDQMIVKMLHADRQRSRAPHVQRRCVAISEIRDAVDQILQASGLPDAVEVLWDGADNPKLSIFGDSTLLTRMIVDLASQSVRSTPAGGCVLIRVQSDPDGDTLRWSLIDQGPGISTHEIQQMLNQPDDIAGAVDLPLCQQISALHFSWLEIYSRINGGTEISFETPRSGPRSVVAVWSRWRSMQLGSRPDSNTSAVNVVDAASGQLRFDSAPARMILSQVQEQPCHADSLMAGTVNLGATISRVSADAFDRCLQSQIRMHELVYRVGTRRWVWALDQDDQSIQRRIESISMISTSVIPGIRMTWSQPVMIPVDARQTNLRLSELLVRQSLAESTNAGIVDKDTVRMGTAPMTPSQTTSDRLDEELRRLSSQLRMQADRIGRQARNLRPRV